VSSSFESGCGFCLFGKAKLDAKSGDNAPCIEQAHSHQMEADLAAFRMFVSLNREGMNSGL